MTLCPIALAVTCKRCPAVGWCPAKATLGDYVPDKPKEAAPPAPASRAATRKPTGHKAPGNKAPGKKPRTRKQAKPNS